MKAVPVGRDGGSVWGWIRRESVIACWGTIRMSIHDSTIDSRQRTKTSASGQTG